MYWYLSVEMVLLAFVSIIMYWKSAGAYCWNSVLLTTHETMSFSILGWWMLMSYVKITCLTDRFHIDSNSEPQSFISPWVVVDGIMFRVLCGLTYNCPVSHSLMILVLCATYIEFWVWEWLHRLVCQLLSWSQVRLFRQPLEANNLSHLLWCIYML